MKKNITHKKITVLLASFLMLFGVTGIAMAKLTAINDSKNITNITTSTKIQDGGDVPPGGDAVIQNEIGSVEKSVKKTEDVLNNLEQNVNENKDNSKSEMDSSLREIKNRGFLKNNKETDNIGETIRTQVEALKVLKKENEIKSTESIKEDLINKVKKSTEKGKGNENDNEKEVRVQENRTSTTTDALKNSINTEIENGLNGIKNVEKNTEKDVSSIENIVLKKKEKITVRAKTKKSRVSALKDSDGDGISNYDEINIYGTDPFSADTNGNGYVDGAEILAGFNPNSKSGNSQIAYGNPKKSGIVDKSLFAVSKIDVKVEKIKIAENKNPSATSTPSVTATSTSVVSFKGKSLPNSFVTLFIYSIPTVVTVKTDEDGNWNYTMDKELENGNHELYVAMTDGSGQIIAKSDPIPFVKRALAVTVNQKLLSDKIDSSKPSFFSLGYVYTTALILVLLIGVALTVIGVKLRFRKEKIEDIV